MTFKRTAIVLGGLALAAGAVVAPQAAQARVWVGVGIGVPYYGWGYGPGYYYAPPPVYYAPPPAYYPPPAPVTYAAPPRQDNYYCANPQGYYPSVQSCNVQWQAVPNAPPAR